MLRPRISVVMPVFNCEKTLETAVRSIVAQSFQDWELLIVDDGSSDRSREMARELRDERVRVVQDGLGNRGSAFRLNEGVDAARGEVIARMDGDDISFPQRLARQWEFLKKQPEVDLVGCSMVLFKNSGKLLGVQRARISHDEICGSTMRSCLLPHATWMGRTNWFRANRYDTRRRRVEDRELLLRARGHSRFAGIDEVMYAYRVERVSIAKNALARREYAAALWQDAVRRGRPSEGILAAGAEMAKLLIDSVALGTRTECWILRHRQARAGERIPEEWRRVWSGLQSGLAEAC
ncbi:MAG TPA: glycosyltransferase family A protein [Candidatus Koribacter sp.]|jgi:glycosyltransferase involved in cell wall biosynthesis